MSNIEFYNHKDVMRILNVKQAYAYRLIQRLNAELEEQGYIVKKGRILKSYFDERMGSNHQVG